MMKSKKKIGLLHFSFFSIFFLFLIYYGNKGFEQASADAISYIYLDLNCSSVTINSSDYSGCIYETVGGVTSTKTISGSHSATNYYYIYQSNSKNQSSTGLVDGNMIVPTYTSLNDTITSFINNTDVESVITKWDTDAGTIGRVATGNYITISESSTYNIVIDNLWSSYHPTGTSRKLGGITVLPSSGMQTSLKLKGENRFGNIFWFNSSTSSSLEITSIDGNNATTGSLVVANLVNNAKNNYWNSGIGGSDNAETAYGIKLSGGTIYVGTTVGDNCTSIGAGGNGSGQVHISGGIVTAVSSSTGTAIGGGIGMNSRGGDATVNITGGEVYAYNFGQVYSGAFVPGVAIGGGSSKNSSGNLNTTVNISGGKVYAQSLGGVAIGGGSSVTTHGGPATITISGTANVTASSTSGTYKSGSKTYQIASGSGIGGGTGGTGGNGGDATVTISGGYVNSGTIGGGETNNASGVVGSANIVINGGTIEGRVIMHTGTFDMTGGILTGGQSEIGGCLQMYSGTATITGGEIKNCQATTNGGAIYLGGGNFYSKGGKIYNNQATYGGGVYIADGTVEVSNGSIEGNTSTKDGAGVYIGGQGSFKMTGGSLSNNQATTGSGGGVYLSDGSFELDGGIISGNISSVDGGGLYIKSGTVLVNSGSLKENKAVNGAGGYISGGTFSLYGGDILNNISSSNGGGIYIADGSLEMTDGTIANNSSVNGAGGYIASGKFKLSGGMIKENISSSNGGGIFIGQGTVEVSSGQINNNQAVNGAGGYISGGTFTLTGGNTIGNIASGNGGGYYISDTTTVSLSNGVISNNQALNGGGFYQTQTSGSTSTTLSGTCFVNNNQAINGNGGGIYIDGGSLFRMINGKVIYNTAKGNPRDTDLKVYIYQNNVATTNQMVAAKDSTAGVGGGVYIKNGTFTMKNVDGTLGNAAIFGNESDYAADDLFAYGNGQTSFDAIPVLDMVKDDAYLNSTDWYEDYPLGEYHTSLRISDASSSITSFGRYKTITIENELVLADSVLSTSEDYICITMGANVGTLILKIEDEYVGSDNVFLYKIISDENDIDMRVSVKKGEERKIENVPIGIYQIKLEPTWSWRYQNNFSATLYKGNTKEEKSSASQIEATVVGGQTLTIGSKYELINKKYFAKNVFIDVLVNYQSSLEE